MSWWRRLQREPPPPRGRHHRGTPVDEVVDPAEFTERLTGMIAAYVPSGEDEAATSAAYDGVDVAAGRPSTAVTDPGAPDVAAREAAGPNVAGPNVAGPGTVVLGFADGSTVALEPGDSRTRPFLTLTDALTSR